MNFEIISHRDDEAVSMVNNSLVAFLLAPQINKTSKNIIRHQNCFLVVLTV